MSTPRPRWSGSTIASIPGCITGTPGNTLSKTTCAPASARIRCRLATASSSKRTAWPSMFKSTRSAPFFLFYNISPPHMPLLDAPEHYRTLYRPEDVPLRPNVYRQGELAYDEHWFKIYLWDFLYYQENLPHTRNLPPGFDLSHLIALYYGMTTWVDDMVGPADEQPGCAGPRRPDHRRFRLGPRGQPGQPSRVQQEPAHRGSPSASP